MKTILVPTDFSATSKNAIFYAAELAKSIQAKIMLLHVRHFPIVSLEKKLLLSEEKAEKDAEKSIKKLIVQLKEKFGQDLNVEYLIQTGLAMDQILSYAEVLNPTVIVMGMEGQGYFTERLMGNITTALIAKCIYPVLTIDKKVKFKPIKRILLACDYKEIKQETVFDLIKEWAASFQAQVDVLNIIPQPEKVTTVPKMVEGFKLNRWLQEIPHSFHKLINKDVISGINQFISENEVDLVVMIPAAHSMISKLFHEPQTRRMAFHTSAPLLTLPVQKK